MSNIYLRVKASFVVVEGSPGSLYPLISSTTIGQYYALSRTIVGRARIKASNGRQNWTTYKPRQG
jgi:hypothetical protein